MSTPRKQRLSSGGDSSPRRWWIVAVAALGLSTSPGQFAFGAFSLFIEPLEQEFGWARGDMSLALTLFTLCLAITLPFIGRVVDAYGSRRVLAPSMLFLGLALCLLGWRLDALWGLILVYVLIGIFGAGANSPPYMRTVSSWFDRRRGLAIGLAMAGAGLGYAYVPPMVRYINDAYGWRYSFLALGAIVIFVATPLVGLFLKEPGSSARMGRPGAPSAASAEGTVAADRTGDGWREAVGRGVFWMLVAVFALLSFSLYGMLAHFKPMLSEFGLPGETAGWITGMVGIAVMVSRVVIGFLIDRIFAPRVALVVFLLSAAGMFVLSTGNAAGFAIPAALLLGLSMGAEIDLLAYLAGRYFGLKSFAVIYGLLFSAFLVGTALGPWAYGEAYDRYDSYSAMLAAGGGCCALAAILTGFLPRWKDPPGYAS